jgi:hypothetical protein
MVLLLIKFNSTQIVKDYRDDPLELEIFSTLVFQNIKLAGRNTYAVLSLQ